LGHKDNGSFGLYVQTTRLTTSRGVMVAGEFELGTMDIEAKDSTFATVVLKTKPDIQLRRSPVWLSCEYQSWTVTPSINCATLMNDIVSPGAVGACDSGTRARVGLAEGCGVGSGDGVTVGRVEGPRVGLVVGGEVGPSEGFVVGGGLGRANGAKVGSGVGEVGRRVGLTEGANVGRIVGCGEGLNEGCGVGGGEGSGVGSPDW
jgi:hypothetical protein